MMNEPSPRPQLAHPGWGFLLIGTLRHRRPFWKLGFLDGEHPTRVASLAFLLPTPLGASPGNPSDHDLSPPTATPRCYSRPGPLPVTKASPPQPEGGRSAQPPPTPSCHPQEEAWLPLG
jgi:hypothetical protein